MEENALRVQRDPRAVTRVPGAGPCESIGSVEILACMPYVRRLLSGRNYRLGAPLGPSDLDDLAQEVFLRVWRSRTDFRHEATLEAWVGRFCVLALIDELRRRRIRATAPLEQDELPFSGHPCVEERIDLRNGDYLLPELEARAVVLRLHGGFTFSEAANRMACSQTTVKVAYRRGIERIRYQVFSPGVGHPVVQRTALRIVVREDGSLRLEPEVRRRERHLGASEPRGLKPLASG